MKLRISSTSGIVKLLDIPNTERCDDGYYIEIKTVDDLIKLVNDMDEIIMKRNEENSIDLEIYDSYRE